MKRSLLIRPQWLIYLKLCPTADVRGNCNDVDYKVQGVQEYLHRYRSEVVGDVSLRETVTKRSSFPMNRKTWIVCGNDGLTYDAIPRKAECGKDG